MLRDLTRNSYLIVVLIVLLDVTAWSDGNERECNNLKTSLIEAEAGSLLTLEPGCQETTQRGTWKRMKSLALPDSLYVS